MLSRVRALPGQRRLGGALWAVAGVVLLASTVSCSGHASSGDLSEQSLRALHVASPPFVRAGKYHETGPDGVSTDYYYYGPVTGWRDRNPVLDPDIKWLKDPPQASAELLTIALGELANGCGIGVYSIHKNALLIPSGATLNQQETQHVRTGEMQLIKIGVSCDFHRTAPSG